MKYYYKILAKDNLSIFGSPKLKYKLGLNVDPTEFNKRPINGPGGIYFSEKEDILKNLTYSGKVICKLYVPNSNQGGIVELNKTRNVYNNLEAYTVYKAHSIYIEEFHDIYSKEGIEWMKKEGVLKDEVDYGFISEYCPLEFAKTMPEIIVKDKFSYNSNLTEKDLDKYEDMIDWEIISSARQLSADTIRKYQDKLDWESISCQQNLTEDLIREFQDRISFDKLRDSVIHRYLNEDFIREFADRFDWNVISSVSDLSEDLMREFQDRLNWYYVSANENLSYEFIREFQDRLNWEIISENLEFRTNREEAIKFVEEFKDKLVWNNVPPSCITSEDLLLDVEDQITDVLHFCELCALPGDALIRFIERKGIDKDRLIIYLNSAIQYFHSGVLTTPYADWRLEDTLKKEDNQ